MLKSGFVYIWYDRKHARFYIGSHWGTERDGYVCSSNWMRRAYRRRPDDFKRRVIQRVESNRIDLFKAEEKWLQLIKQEEIKVRYYNLTRSVKNLWHQHPEKVKEIGQKISQQKLGKKTGPRSQEVKDRISAATKGKKKTLTPESVAWKKGRKLTEERRLNISAGLKRAYAEGRHTTRQRIK